MTASTGLGSAPCSQIAVIRGIHRRAPWLPVRRTPREPSAVCRSGFCRFQRAGRPRHHGRPHLPALSFASSGPPRHRANGLDERNQVGLRRWRPPGAPPCRHVTLFRLRCNRGDWTVGDFLVIQTHHPPVNQTAVLRARATCLVHQCRLVLPST